MYKGRTPNEVMDHVYDDLMYAFQNVRLNDGENVLNRYVVAGFISRLCFLKALGKSIIMEMMQEQENTLNLL